MAHLTLEGTTLGQRQQHFNKLVNEAFAKKLPFDEIKASEENSDIDKMYKIDIASKYRIVDYILETFKSEDMLHVSRAIKQSTWLITDPQYSHIVNPQYLNNILFPEMTAKASCKLLLHVRLNLKDEKRVELFYKYYDSKDLPKIALKWLPMCSLEFIKSVVTKLHEQIDKNLFVRLCERSVAVLELFVEINKDRCRKEEYAAAVMFLMNTDIIKYLNIVEKVMDQHRINLVFGPKYTKLILKKCPERITGQFYKYAYRIDSATLGKHLGKQKALVFFLKHIKNSKIKSWFTYHNTEKLLREIPKEEKFPLIKRVFIDKTTDDQNQNDSPYVRYSAEKSQTSKSNQNIILYQWYKHAPFDVAFTELKKLIRVESSPDKRNAIMSVMLDAAGFDAQNVEAVIQYYHDRHINESFIFKLKFVEHLFSVTNTHTFGEKSWKLLDELFHSMELYTETSNRVTKCINAIVIYKVLHNESIPEAIEKKFNIQDLIFTLPMNLNPQEKELLFTYLYNYIKQQIKDHVITNQQSYDNAITLVNIIFQLLHEWNKEICDYPVLLQKIREILMSKEKSWTTNNLVHVARSWRKYLFEESLLLSPSENACLNALKHDPDLLKRYASEIDSLRYDDNVSLKKLQSKLRVYFPQSLGREWANEYSGRLEKPGCGQNAVVRALCTLLPSDELLPIIKKYAPDNHKITWSEADEVELRWQKSIAQTMHTARPQPPPEAVLWYAKGDYLQFVLPSLSAIFYNLSAVRCYQYLPQLLNAPVSVQKHGIRIACSKMTFEQGLKELLTKAWSSTKNSSIRTVIFQLTHDLLCQEKSPEKSEKLWQLLEMFISRLSEEENKDIYNLMGNVSSIPISIRHKYLVKCYKFLKSLPAKLECESLLNNLGCSIADIMNKIDSSFVKNVIMEHFEQFYIQNKCQGGCYRWCNDVITSYLIWGQTEEMRNKRYEDVFVPIMNYAFQHWNEMYKKQYMVRHAFNDLINTLFETCMSNALRMEIEMPLNLFRNVQKKMEDSIKLAKNYEILRMWQLKVAFVQCFAEARALLDVSKYTNPKFLVQEHESADFDDPLMCETKENNTWNELCIKLIPDFGAQCIRYLKEDVAISPVFYKPLSECLSEMLCRISFNRELRKALYEVLLASDSEEFIYGHLVVLNLLPKHCGNADKDSLMNCLQRIQAHPSVVVQMQYNIVIYHNPELIAIIN